MKTLDDIEHRTLRRDFNEPRLHVALVCAAMGCPPLGLYSSKTGLSTRRPSKKVY